MITIPAAPPCIRFEFTYIQLDEPMYSHLLHLVVNCLAHRRNGRFQFLNFNKNNLFRQHEKSDRNFSKLGDLQKFCVPVIYVQNLNGIVVCRDLQNCGAVPQLVFGKPLKEKKKFKDILLCLSQRKKLAPKEQRDSDSMKSLCENKGKCLEPK